MKSSTLTPREASRETGLSLQYVYVLAQTGRIRAEKVDGRWQLDAQDLSKYLAS